MLTNTNTNAAVYEEKVNVANPPFAEDNTLYTRSGCLPPDGSYKFTLFDDWGDGLCCTRGLGYFQLYLDFANELSVEPFWYSWYGAVDGPLVNDGVLYEFDTQEIEFQSGNEFGCQNGQVRFSLSFLSDYWVEDYSWVVEQEVSSGNFRLLDSGDNYVDRNALFMDESSLCLGNGRYRFIFSDDPTYRDGFCCSSVNVNPTGYYAYSFNGETFRRRDNRSRFYQDRITFEVSNNRFVNVQVTEVP
jgi:hypothetical protein